ncbi:hypothetical protein SK3146_02969 [Paenibacillus konkukensis]|uniref:Spore germination GerAC-like C-terminal domain-containing protein n=1 Tax=Paenibacillus konkukensis TaxID=2020716 RepID=A0ABY4RNZ4_9BACL|nr:Ger(x)C family spore germination C-terminal domain-containing protein [Paenibacillus konkukensis]UQZ83762.1 hypothetical protein SK3146_02969 [Paenibacillus konkukensis]
MGVFHHWLRGSQDNRTKQWTDDVLNGTIASSLSVNLQHLSALFNGIPERYHSFCNGASGYSCASASARDIETRYTNNQFQFNVKLKLDVSLAERTFNMNMGKNGDDLSAVLTGQLAGELNRLIQKIQKQELDPFGFGDYARAFQYRHWKTVEENWPAAFAKAAVTVSPALKILDHGIIE